MKVTVTIVAASGRKNRWDTATAFSVETTLDLGDARRLVRKALATLPATPARQAAKEPTPEQRARWAERDRREAERIARAALREEKKREKDRARAAREAKRKERQEKKDAAAARKATRTWLKETPLSGDAVEYQEKPHGRWHVGRVVGVVGLTHDHYKIVGDRGTRLYPNAQVKRTLKPTR